jgi:hypothetical protein
VNPFLDISELTITCCNRQLDEVASEMVKELNRPAASTLASHLPLTQEVVTVFDVRRAAVEFSLLTDVGLRRRRKRMVLLWAPKTTPDATAIVDNLLDRNELVIARLSRRLDWKIITGQSLDRPEDQFPGFVFSYSEQMRAIRRTIATSREQNAWTYHSSGSPLPFERPTSRVRGEAGVRLSRDTIAEYFSACGYEIANSSFWESDELGVYLF